MRMILRNEVRGLGKRGDIVEVTSGYARNFLVPQGLAFPATAGLEAQAEAMRRTRSLKDAKDREEAEMMARRLVSAVVTIPARAADTERLFGSVGVADVIAAVAEQQHVELSKKHVRLDEPIRSLGRHAVVVHPHPEVEFSVQIEVVPG